MAVRTKRWLSQGPKGSAVRARGPSEPIEFPIICVVDDDAAVLSALKFALEVEGMDVRTYDGPVSLLNDPNSPPYACLVVDYRMPVMDGLELIGVLRRRGVTAPVVVITGHANKQLRAQTDKLGVHRLLEKPLPDGALLDAIRSALPAQI